MKNRNTERSAGLSRLGPLLTVLLLAVAAPCAFAEKADRDKPVNVEADRANVDDANKVSVYEGNVVLTQGTLVIRGDKMVVTEDAEGFQHGTVYGNPAYFKQKREGVDEYIEGWAQRMEYDSRKDLLEMFTQARIRRDKDEARGNYISYDGNTEFFKVVGGKEAVTATNPKGRVHTVIQPKKKAAQQPASPVPLKPTENITTPGEE